MEEARNREKKQGAMDSMMQADKSRARDLESIACDSPERQVGL